MFASEQKRINQSIATYCSENGLPEPELHWSWIPFSGHWGISTSFFNMAAAEARQGKKVVVGQRAQEIASDIAEFLGTPDGFAKVEAVKGYLNLSFSTELYARRVIDTVLEEGLKFGNSAPKSKKVMVEFSQPNTHKAFHVGHLRNVILGAAVCNIMEGAGYEVVRANYIGDIGLHVIKWLWNYQKYHHGETPAEDKTRWMGTLYAEADRRFEEEPTAEPEVREYFGRWDKREPEIVKLWEKTRGWSMEGFHQIYSMLGVTFDKIYYESEVEDSGKDIVKDLIAKGIARDERPEGAVIIPLDELLGTKDRYRVMVILRSDGTSLYATKDLPLAINKVETYHLDQSIYVIDARQSLYMQQIFKVLELMGYEWSKNLKHLAYEIVNLPGNVTMSSRDGTVVLLQDLVDEATRRALVIVQTKNPDLPVDRQEAIARAVALGALKYSMISRDNVKIVTFDWEAAMDINGQAAPYIQYAYVRANSILRKSGLVTTTSVSPAYKLTEAEIELIDLISRLPREVGRAAEELKPLYIANISYEIARAFNNFYNQCPVLQADEVVRNFRLRLVLAARQAISNSLALMGITAPEAM
ncbi:MAG: arginine--tRNA ligase [Anaerolineaceae bacterium]